MDRRHAAFTLAQLLTVIAVISALFALLVPALARARKSALERDCNNHLRQVDSFITMYVTRGGAGGGYPPARGMGYFETLTSVPTPSRAVAGGCETLFCCMVLRREHLPVMDFREPIERLSPTATPAGRPVLCDRPTNHDPGGEDDINVLYFSGCVTAVSAGSPEWNEALRWTQ